MNVIILDYIHLYTQAVVKPNFKHFFYAGKSAHESHNVTLIF